MSAESHHATAESGLRTELFRSRNYTYLPGGGSREYALARVYSALADELLKNTDFLRLMLHDLPIFPKDCFNYTSMEFHEINSVHVAKDPSSSLFSYRHAGTIVWLASTLLGTKTTTNDSAEYNA